MYLHALATAVPAQRYTQRECWGILQRSSRLPQLTRRSRLLLHRVLGHDHGIATRHFAARDIDGIFDRSPDELNAMFRAEAPALAGRAFAAALDRARLVPTEVDALFICTCTGYLCPGVSSYVAERVGLRADTTFLDLAGLGCGAAIPMLRAASDFLSAHPGATVACVAVEVCSAAFYLDDDTGVLISACLFADGAAATLWRQTPGPTGLRAFDFRSLHRPAQRDMIRFEIRHGKLRNLLDATVPALAADAVGELWRSRGDRPVAGVVAHAGGRDVLESLAPVVAPFPLDASARVLRAYGNMSSPSVLFALEDVLSHGPPPLAGDFWLVSFGAGFSAHSCRLGAV